MPAGNFANASLVGAKTVNGPGDCSVSTRPAAFTAATSVVWSFEFTAFCTMFFDGYIGAPPTVTVFSFSFICAKAGPRCAEAECECRCGNAGQRDGDDAFHGCNSVALCDVPMRETSKLRSAAPKDARSQRRELTCGDHRSSGQAGGRTAWRLQRYREHGVVFRQRRKLGGQGKHHGLIGAQQAHGTWSAVRRDEPQLGNARCIGTEGGRHDCDRAARRIDGSDEMTMAAAFDRCDERLLAGANAPK